jgi:hypothetical protein
MCSPVAIMFVTRAQVRSWSAMHGIGADLRVGVT